MTKSFAALALGGLLICAVGAQAQTGGPMTSASQKPSDPLSGEALYADVKHYESFGVHRYGTAGADAALGTPDGTVILARSENPLPSFQTVLEELLSPNITINGEEVADLSRGEIVYFETPSGGAVFSVGSITFCGSLWRSGFEGPVSQLLENVVRRFAQA